MKTDMSAKLRVEMQRKPFDCVKARKLSLKLHELEAAGQTLTMLTERLWMDLTVMILAAEGKN